MKFKLVLLTILLFAPTLVNASEIISASCQKQEEDYVCEISGNFEYEISALDFHFSLPTTATLDHYQIDSRWIGEIQDDWITLYSNNNSKDTFPIVKFVIKSNKNIDGNDILFHDIKVYDADFKEHEIVLPETNIETSSRINVVIILIIGAILLVGAIIIIVRRKGDSK